MQFDVGGSAVGAPIAITQQHFRPQANPLGSGNVQTSPALAGIPSLQCQARQFRVIETPVIASNEVREHLVGMQAPPLLGRVGQPVHPGPNIPDACCR